MARTVDTERRRELALRAFEVIRSRGVAKTTMSDIAVALEMKRPTLYWHFKDFGEIFDAVVAETDTELERFVRGRLAGVAHPIDTLAALVEATVDFYAERRDRVMVLFQLFAVAGDSAAERFARRARQFVRPVREELRARLERGIADGIVAPCDATIVVDLCFAVIDGAHVQKIVRDADPRRVVEGLRRHVLEPLRLDGGAQPASPEKNR